MPTPVVAVVITDPMVKNFYRIYILPRHIATAKRKGKKEREENLAAELKRRRADVKHAGMEAEFDAYVEAQEHKQAVYDALLPLQQAVNADQGNELAIAALAKGEQAVVDSRDEFKARYH